MGLVSPFFDTWMDGWIYIYMRIILSLISSVSINHPKASYLGRNYLGINVVLQCIDPNNDSCI